MEPFGVRQYCFRGSIESFGGFDIYRPPSVADCRVLFEIPSTCVRPPLGISEVIECSTGQVANPLFHHCKYHRSHTLAQYVAICDQSPFAVIWGFVGV